MKKRLTLLIFTACAVFVGSVGLIFWALAATQVNITSGLLVTYTPTPQVVCNTSATYQRTNDASAVAFKDGNLSFGYGDATPDATLEATTNALQLDDSNTYVVFEFTFTNQNDMENYDLTITLTDNGTVTNMTRKYYFGDLSSSNISAKRTTIKNSGIDNSSLSSQKLVLGYQKTGRIYMLLEITPGTVASYLADNTNKFVFNMTTAEHEVEKVSYLHPDWAQIILEAPSNASMIYEGSTDQPILGAPDPTVDLPFEEIIFTKDILSTSGLTNSVSVGTISETSTENYTLTEDIDDVIAYWGSDKSTIVIYSPSKIYAPQNCISLFSHFYNIDNHTNFCFGLVSRLDLTNFDTSKVTDMTHMFYDCSSLTSLDVSNFDTSKVTGMSAMFFNCSSLTSLDVSNFDTSKVTYMSKMFNECYKLTSLDVSNFDTSKVTDMSYMFSGCSALASLDLGNFNLASCTNFNSMLSDCSALTSITLPYNLQSGYTISLPASTYYNGSAGPYSTIYTATNGTMVACSTETNKITLKRGRGQHTG